MKSRGTFDTMWSKRQHAGVRLLAPIPVAVVIPAVAAGLLAVEIFWSYRRFASLVKWLTLVLFRPVCTRDSMITDLD